MPDARLYLQSEMDVPQLVELAGGRACVFSRRCPGKPTPNEDAALLMSSGDAGALLAVADGMGGQTSGEIASRLAVESLRDEVAALDSSDTLLRTALINGIERANTSIQQAVSGAGTTLAAVEISQNTARPYHIGDSVVLIVGGRGRIKLQTVAHSPVGYGVEAGLLDETDAMHHGDRHVVSNFIGAPDMRIDIGSPITLARHDTVLLASDGLFDNLQVEEVAEIIRKGPLLRAVTDLIAVANLRMDQATQGRPSKPDDLTVVAYRRTG